MKQAKSLIVGAAGQVGALLAELLGGEALPSVRATDGGDGLVVDLAAMGRDPSLAHATVGHLDLKAVYCAGGATDVERCESDAEWAMNTNCYGPAALAAACRAVPFVYFSTDYVFDGLGGPYSEDDATNALSVYGRSKLEGERRVMEAHPDALILRTTVVYGVDPQGKNFLYTLRRLLSSGQTMRVASDQVSSPTYNADLARAAVELVGGGYRGIFNAAGPELMSRYEFAVRAAGILGLDAGLLTPAATAELKQRAPRPLQAGFRIDKLQRTLGPAAMRTCAEGISEWARVSSHSAAREIAR